MTGSKKEQDHEADKKEAQPGLQGQKPFLSSAEG
jgi:hypothetical protein